MPNLSERGDALFGAVGLAFLMVGNGLLGSLLGVRATSRDSRRRDSRRDGHVLRRLSARIADDPSPARNGRAHQGVRRSRVARSRHGAVLRAPAGSADLGRAALRLWLVHVRSVRHDRSSTAAALPAKCSGFGLGEDQIRVVGRPGLVRSVRFLFLLRLAHEIDGLAVSLIDFTPHRSALPARVNRIPVAPVASVRQDGCYSASGREGACRGGGLCRSG